MTQKQRPECKFCQHVQKLLPRTWPLTKHMYNTHNHRHHPRRHSHHYHYTIMINITITSTITIITIINIIMIIMIIGLIWSSSWSSSLSSSQDCWKDRTTYPVQKIQDPAEFVLARHGIGRCKLRSGSRETFFFFSVAINLRRSATICILPSFSRWVDMPYDHTARFRIYDICALQFPRCNTYLSSIPLKY